MNARALVGACFVIGLMIALAGTVQAGGAHLYGKVGIDANGEYDDPLTFVDRLVYQGGLDVGIIDMLTIGPEISYQRISGELEEFGLTDKYTVSIFGIFGNLRLEVPGDLPAKPYGGVGVGAMHVGVDQKIEGFQFDESVTKAAIQGFGGAVFGGHFLAEVKIVHMFVEDADTDIWVNFGVRF
ncbi:MAG: hypothetical protein AB1714_25670 [Acidobacteriota bacterium]